MEGSSDKPVSGIVKRMRERFSRTVQAAAPSRTRGELQADAEEVAATGRAEAQVLASLPGSRVMAVTREGVEAFQEEELLVLRAPGADGSEPVVALIAGSFKYPLCGQPIMRVRRGVYMLPSEAVGSSFCLRVETCNDVDVLSLESALAAFAVLRERDTGELVLPPRPVGVSPPAAPLPSAPPLETSESPAPSAPPVETLDAARSAAEGGWDSWMSYISESVASLGGGAASTGGSKEAAEAAGESSSYVASASAAVSTAVQSAHSVASSAWSAVSGAVDATVAEKEARFPALAEDRPSRETARRREETAPAEEAGDAAAWGRTHSAVMSAGQWTAAGLVVGARYAGAGIRTAGSALMSRLAPVEAGKEAEVSESTIRNLQRAHMATSTAVVVTKGLVVTMTELAKGLGTAVAKIAGGTEQGKKLSAKMKSSALAKGLRDVGLASLIALGDVWEGLEEGLQIVGGDVAETTHDVVKHRYGDKAADATKRGFDVAGEAGKVVWNVRSTVPTALAVTAGRTAAQRTILDEAHAEAARRADKDRRRRKGKDSPSLSD
jgi:hypothetical protein